MAEHDYTTPDERDKFLIGCIQVVKNDGDNKQALLGIQAELTRLRADNERLRAELKSSKKDIMEANNYRGGYRDEEEPPHA